MSFQVSLAQMEYQLPRLTKMWTHLERQAGGKVKGMGEKQIEVDKRILRTQVSDLSWQVLIEYKCFCTWKNVQDVSLCGSLLTTLVGYKLLISLSRKEKKILIIVVVSVRSFFFLMLFLSLEIEFGCKHIPNSRLEFSKKSLNLLGNIESSTGTGEHLYLSQ